MKTIEEIEEAAKVYAEAKANPIYRKFEVAISEAAFKAGAEFANQDTTTDSLDKQVNRVSAVYDVSYRASESEIRLETLVQQFQSSCTIQDVFDSIRNSINENGYSIVGNIKLIKAL